MRHVAPRKGRAAKPRRGTTAAAVPAASAGLLERLKNWRTEQARAQSVPAYVIFHDRTLAEIAAARPADIDALATVSGIGAKKLERYGESLLELVRG
jgi:ATP-dependent DNA helicase RecQ